MMQGLKHRLGQLLVRVGEEKWCGDRTAPELVRLSDQARQALKDTQPSERATPRVKRLEWVDVSVGDNSHYMADTPLGRYRVRSVSHRLWDGFRGRDFIVEHDTLEQAQQACQDDHDKRVLSALESV